MNAVEVSGLTKRFGKVEAVRDISFTVARGATAALLGGNGAGKTTTISTLLGVLLPTAGRIVVLGEDIARHRWDYFWTTVALNALYLLVGVAVFLASFNGARKRGMLLQIGE